MAARALLAFQGRAWAGATLNQMAGAMLLADAIDNLRCLKKFADDYRKASRRRGKRGGRKRRR